MRSPRGRLCCSGTEPDAEPLPVPAPWAPARVLRPRMRSWQICDRRRVRGCVVRSKGGEPERAQTARGRASECICGALQAQNPPACHTRRRRRAPCALARSRKTCCNHDASVHGSLRPSAFRTSRTGCLTARDGRVVARARMRTRARARTHTHTEAAAVECPEGVCESAVPCHACRWARCAGLLHLLRLPGSTCVARARICNNTAREIERDRRTRACERVEDRYMDMDFQVV